MSLSPSRCSPRDGVQPAALNPLVVHVALQQIIKEAERRIALGIQMKVGKSNGQPAQCCQTLTAYSAAEGGCRRGLTPDCSTRAADSASLSTAAAVLTKIISRRMFHQLGPFRAALEPMLCGRRQHLARTVC